jgi:hypothetical protein
MTDSTGRVAVAGWYDDVAPLGARRAGGDRRAPRWTARWRRQLGLARTTAAARTLWS